MKNLTAIFVLSILFSYTAAKKKIVIVWQPSHQTNTGRDFNEAVVSNAIAEAAMTTNPVEKYRVMHGRNIKYGV